MIINKQDTDGTKATLAEGEFGYDKQGFDRGRVWMGTNAGNKALAALDDFSKERAIRFSQSIVEGTLIAGDKFGCSIAISENRILIGAKEDDGAATRAGAAYLFDHTGRFIKKLVSEAPLGNGYFGTIVALSSDRVLVTDPSAVVNSLAGAGAVAMFDLNGKPLKIITHPTPTEYGSFGKTVSVHGNRLVVGESGEDISGVSNAGAAFIFDSNGLFLTRITSEAPTEAAFFGASVAVGTKIVVGEPQKTIGGITYNGVVSIFSLGGIFESSLTLDEVGKFGESVAIDGDYLVVGSPNFNSNNGKVSIFHLPTFEVVYIEGNSTYYGSAVAISGKVVAVSAFNKTVEGVSSAGAISVYTIQGDHIKDIVAKSLGQSDKFGLAVSICGDALLGGTPYAPYPDNYGKVELTLGLSNEKV